jgi:hypothetical protein
VRGPMEEFECQSVQIELCGNNDCDVGPGAMRIESCDFGAATVRVHSPLLRASVTQPSGVVDVDATYQAESVRGAIHLNQ